MADQFYLRVGHIEQVRQRILWCKDHARAARPGERAVTEELDGIAQSLAGITKQGFPAQIFCTGP